MEKNLKTLVIHPKDASTDCLSVIYADRGWTVINTEVSHSALKKAITEHDRIVMMGHGDGNGLFGFGHYMIDSKLGYLLREKECVAIWCFANSFFLKYELTGFYTGMIISEHDEACYMGIYHATDAQIESSNTLFSSSIQAGITEKGFLDIARELYVSEDNPIIHYNQVRMYITENSLFVKKDLEVTE